MSDIKKIVFLTRVYIKRFINMENNESSGFTENWKRL